nr:MAG TPA: hypothetical protein [Caudoviricetes sp.]
MYFLQNKSIGWGFPSLYFLRSGNRPKHPFSEKYNVKRRF